MLTRRMLFSDWQGVLQNGWRDPQIFLLILALSVPVAFETWMALINNFAVDEVDFSGLERGILETIREIPGFLAFTVVYLLLIWQQQTFAILSISVMGLGVAITGMLPTVWGLYFTTIVMSVGFHYLSTIKQSLAMQWTSVEMLPLVLGRMAAVASAGSLISYGFVYVAFEFLESPYWVVYAVAGVMTMGLGALCRFSFPRFSVSGYQAMTLVLRRRYWLYYALEFMSGGRRQIFVGFAAFPDGLEVRVSPRSDRCAVRGQPHHGHVARTTRRSSDHAVGRKAGSRVRVRRSDRNIRVLRAGRDRMARCSSLHTRSPVLRHGGSRSRAISGKSRITRTSQGLPASRSPSTTSRR